MWKLGVSAWSFVGLAAAVTIVLLALAAVSEVTLPLVLAALLAVELKLWADALRRRGLRPSFAAGAVTLGLFAAACGAIVAAVAGVVDQASEIDVNVQAAIARAGEDLDAIGLDQTALNRLDAAVRNASPVAGDGVLTHLVSGVGSIVGFVSGLILGALIMYYLIKDGTEIRRTVVAQFDPELRGEVDGFIGDACDVLRRYWAGRTVMSVIVAAVIGGASLVLGLPLVATIVVVNFVGGYIPYVGAFVGGALAVIVALGTNGLGSAMVMLVVVLVANLVLENLVEPKVMGGSLGIHPVVVLVVTALGGVVGGVVGLLLAVPTTAVLVRLVARLRAAGYFTRVAAASAEIMRRG